MAFLLGFCLLKHSQRGRQCFRGVLGKKKEKRNTRHKAHESCLAPQEELDALPTTCKLKLCSSIASSLLEGLLRIYNSSKDDKGRSDSQGADGIVTCRLWGTPGRPLLLCKALATIQLSARSRSIISSYESQRSPTGILCRHVLPLKILSFHRGISMVSVVWMLFDFAFFSLRPHSFSARQTKPVHLTGRGPAFWERLGDKAPKHIEFC